MNTSANLPKSTARFPDLAGKVAIVTGARRGIGQAIAETLGDQGMKLVLSTRSTEHEEDSSSARHSADAETVWVTADLSVPAGATAVFEAAMHRFGRVDLLVNNAAEKKGGRFLELDEATYVSSFEKNVRIIYGLSRLVAAQMVASGGGSIVHLSSVGGLRAHRRMVGYDAAKGAIDTLTRAMAIELGPHGIRVNALAPGFIPSPEQCERGGANLLARAAAAIPLGRRGTSEEIGAVVAFLASSAAGYITGQVLYVDGGLTAQLSPAGLDI